MLALQGMVAGGSRVFRDAIERLHQVRVPRVLSRFGKPRITGAQVGGVTTAKFTLHKDDSRDRVLGNLHGFIDRLPKTKAWKVEIAQSRKSRTDPQNHALFGVAYPALMEPTGFTKDELHEAFCKRFFGTIEREVMGQVVSKPFRTTTTDENGKRDVMPWDKFSDFYAMVQQVGAESGIYVPDPDPMHAVAA